MYSPQQSARIQELRRKVQDNTITQAELKEGIELLRQGRGVASDASAASKAKKAAKAPVNSDDLLSELGGL